MFKVGFDKTAISKALMERAAALSSAAWKRSRLGLSSRGGPVSHGHQAAKFHSQNRRFSHAARKSTDHKGRAARKALRDREEKKPNYPPKFFRKSMKQLGLESPLRLKSFKRRLGDDV